MIFSDDNSFPTGTECAPVEPGCFPATGGVASHPCQCEITPRSRFLMLRYSIARKDAALRTTWGSGAPDVVSPGSWHTPLQDQCINNCRTLKLSHTGGRTQRINPRPQTSFCSFCKFCLPSFSSHAKGPRWRWTAWGRCWPPHTSNDPSGDFRPN